MPLVDLSPVFLSRQLLAGLGVAMTVQHQERLTAAGPVVLVVNHRSVLDIALVMAALGRPVHFVCHRYMSQAPGLRELVGWLGCLPATSPWELFQQARTYLSQGEIIGIFPEGGVPMVQTPAATGTAPFQSGFAHLTLRLSQLPVTLLPVALTSQEETVFHPFPVALLSLFDPTEPLFRSLGWHPMVLYRQVEVRIGRPILAESSWYATYRRGNRQALVGELTERCQTEIQGLLREDA